MSYSIKISSPKTVLHGLVLFLLFYCLPLTAQKAPEGACDCVYPIIFVHGFGGNAKSFSEIYTNESLTADIWGTKRDTFNAVLNANMGTDIFGGDMQDNPDFSGSKSYQNDDVIYQFMNEENDLRPACFYIIDFDNYWNENPDIPQILKNPPKDIIGESDNPGNIFSPDSRSNQSSIYKQGYALSKAIKRILEKTEKSKVILVGHSMGGLASREYLQRRKENGEYLWWVKPEENKTGHRVAKLLTIGTPHRGSNTNLSVIGDGFDDVLGFNIHSESTKDLRYRYSAIAIPPFEKSGVYLYGGTEWVPPILTQDVYYYNFDINCNGVLNETIKGINIDGTTFQGGNNLNIWDGTFDNLSMPLPRNLKYTYYISNFKNTACIPNTGVYGCKGDLVVDDMRQWLFKGGSGSTSDFLNNVSIPEPNDGINHRLSDRITSPNRKNHLKQTTDINQIIRGIDEADYPYFAYKINPVSSDAADSDGWYAGITQVRADKVPESSVPNLGNGNTPIFDEQIHNRIDPDWFKFSIDKKTDTIIINFRKNHHYSGFLDFYTNEPKDFLNENGIKIIEHRDNKIEQVNLSNQGSFQFRSTISNDQTKHFKVYKNGGFNKGDYYFRITHFITGNTEEAWTNPYKFRIQTKDAAPICENCNCEINISVEENYDCADKNDVALTINFMGNGSNYTLKAGEFSLENIAPGTHTIGSFAHQQNISISLTEVGTPECTLSISKTITCPEDTEEETEEEEGGFTGNTDPTAAKNIVGVEYWFNDNFSNRVIGASNAYTSLEVNKLMSTNGLDAGVHTLHIRFKDNEGNYSAVVSRTFEKLETIAIEEKTIVAYQYWFDNDYAGRTVEVTDFPFAERFELLKELSTAGLDAGLHTLHIRFVDNTLSWSPTFSQAFQKLPRPTEETNKIVAYRYWFDDKLEDEATISLSNPTTTYTLMEDFDATELAEGGHLFHIQFQDDIGQWSAIKSQFFEKIIIPNDGERELVSYEYWLDNNWEQKKHIEIAPTQTYVLIANLPFTDISSGLHSFNIRFQDNVGKWSAVESQFFEKITIPNEGEKQLVSYEYWLDNNWEQKICVDITPTQTYLLVADLPFGDISPGLHYFNIRFQDNVGKWSPIENQFFEKIGEIPATENEIIGYKYWFNENPEQSVFIRLEQPQKVVELITDINANQLPNGTHTFQIQFQDAIGQWTTVIRDTFSKDTENSPENMIFGNVLTWKDYVVADAEIRLNEEVINLSDETGSYSIVQNLGSTITVTKNDLPIAGVSVSDLVIIQLHILGRQFFDSPWQYIAADVNGNGAITLADIITILQVIRNQRTDWPNNVPIWRFIDAETEFMDPSNPLQENWQEYISIDENTSFYDFIGVKTGDVKGTWNTNTFAPSRTAQLESSIPDYLWNEAIYALENNIGLDASLYLRTIKSQPAFEIQPTLLGQQDLIITTANLEIGSEIIIHDQLGRVVHQLKNPNPKEIIDRHIFTGTGIYFITLQSKKYFASKRVLTF